MTSLANQPCLPEDGSEPTALNATECEALLQEVPGWRIENHRLVRKEATNSFVKGVELISKVTPVAEEAGHHPDITLTYPTLTIELITHSADALTKADFVMAARIDKACFS